MDKFGVENMKTDLKQDTIVLLELGSVGCKMCALVTYLKLVECFFALIL